MKNDIKVLYDDIQALWHKVSQVCFEFQNVVAQIPREELVDCGYFMREMRNACDDMRKNCDAKQQVAGRYLAAQAGAAAMQDIDLKLEGEYATAVPDIIIKPRLPRRGSPEYMELLDWIGVSREVASRNLLNFSFTEMAKIVTERLSRGENPPPGIMATHTDAVVVFRKKRGVNETTNDEVTDDIAQEDN
jgi:hypothetical protein